MTKVVYNSDYGGFDLSKQQKDRYLELSGQTDVDIYDMSRHDPNLIKLVEEDILYKSRILQIEDIGDEPKYYIEEYDGNERVYTIKTIPWVYV